MPHAQALALKPLGPDDPREVSGYRLLAKIGEGGMGSVYLTRSRGEQPVALKLIRREFAQSPDFRARFEAEVQAARRVSGYHIVPVLDHNVQGDQPWVATTYVPGLALDEALAAFGPLPLPAAFQLIGCVARALVSIHAPSVIHRDLKPSNILLSSEGPWVIDFGIAHTTDTTHLTRTGGFIGTPQYMSPEHALGQKVTRAADIFALGLIAAVVTTGRHPYGDGSGLSVAAQIANTQQRPPDLGGYPDQLRPLLEACLAADPAQRPAPIDLADLCERASKRLPRDFANWLPAPLAAEIARWEQAAQEISLQIPASARSVPPVAAPTPSPDFNVAYAPTQTGPGRPPHGSPQAATGPYTAAHNPGSPPAAESRGRSKVLLSVGATAIALLLIAGGIWHLTRSDGQGKDLSKGSDRKASQSKEPASDPATPEPSPAKHSYAVVFKDRPLKLLAPTENRYYYADLDAPKVAPFTDTDSSDHELRMGFMAVTTFTQFGKSEGPTPAECEAAVATAPIPDKMDGQDLQENSEISQGDLLCTVTSKGNLAMAKVVGVQPERYNGRLYYIPTYLTEVTLWRRQS